MLSDLKAYLEETLGIILNEEEILVHLLWADDLILMSDSIEGLQKQLDGLFKFCSQFQMIVNELKTKVMVFGKKSGTESFKFNNKTLDIVEQYKYLGCIFNEIKISTGNVNRVMPEFLAEKAMKASFATMKKYSSLGRLTPQVAIHLYDTCVLPILMYGCEVWSDTSENKLIERQQLKYLKLMLGVKASTCNSAIYGETGRFPIFLNQVYRSIKYWLRIERLDNSKIVKKVYIQLKENAEVGFSNWASKIKHLLKTYNMEEFWTKQTWAQCEANTFLITFKEQIYTKYQNNWYEELCSYPKMRTYITFKKQFRFEPYLLEVKDYKLRKAIAKFRLSSHKLEIERGRYHKPPIPADRRLCKLCNSGDVEDEFHVLMKCPIFNDLRSVLFSKLSKCGLSPTFNCILECTDKNCVFYLGKYLDKLFSYRDTALNDP